MTIVSTGALTLKDLNDAKQLSMYIGGSQSRQVIYDGVSTYTPNYATTNNVLTPQLRIAGGGADVSASATATRWYYQTNGAGAVTQITSNTADYTLSTGSQPITLTLKSNLLTTNNVMNYICEMDYIDPDTGFTVTSKADYQIVKVTNGVNGVNSVLAILTNENITLASDSAGTVGSYTASGTDVQVFDGATALTYDGVGTSNGTFKITVTPTNVTAGSISGSGTNKATLANASAMTADTATISIAITGKTLTGNSINLTKVQTLSKSKAGVNATIYYLSIPSTLQKTSSGTYASSTITVKAFQQPASGTPSSYNGYIEISTSVNGTFSDAIVQVPNTTQLSGGAYTWTVTTGIKAYKVKLYSASGGVGQQDEETGYIVQDGTNSIYLSVWTPSGNAVSNSNGYVLAQADIYDGVNVASGSAYKWYVQDPTATIGSGGDADGGNGWRLMPDNGVTPSTAPTMSNGASGGTLAATTYYIRYTWVTATGETYTSPEATKAISAGQTLITTIPAFPTGVLKAKVYVGTTAGVANLKYQGDILTSAGSLTITSPISTTNPIAPEGNAPTVAPTLASVVNAGSTLTATTYYVRYTWVNINGETGSSPEASIAISSGNNLKVTIPAFANGATSANIYIGTTAGASNLRYQGSITTSAGNIQFSAPISTTSLVTPTGYTGVTGVTTSVIYVPASAIQGMEAFKCVATYNSIKYSNTTTVQDLSDPIQVTLTGVDTFKNGIGTSSIKAVLYQNGVEVDSAGTIYTYTWSLYDSNNALITPTYSTLNTGKTVTIDGRDFVARASLVCQISK
jgi:hypothetical protein